MIRSVKLRCLRCHNDCRVQMYGMNYAQLHSAAKSKKTKPFICVRCRIPVTEEAQLELHMAGMR